MTDKTEGLSFLPMASILIFITVFCWLLSIGIETRQRHLSDIMDGPQDGHKKFFDAADMLNASHAYIDHPEHGKMRVIIRDGSGEHYDPDAFWMKIHWNFDDGYPGRAFRLSKAVVVTEDGNVSMTHTFGEFNLKVERKSKGVFEFTYENDTAPIASMVTTVFKDEW